MGKDLWPADHVKLALHLYCRLPFGRCHQRTPEVIELAGLIDRSPGAVAYKLGNLASLDPAIAASGRKGLTGASNLDKAIWAQFHADWEGLALECAGLLAALRSEHNMPAEDLDGDEAGDGLELVDFTGATRQVLVEQRIKQQFFRRAVLGSYRGRCCMSGLAEPRLLLASHIVPWRADKANRLNPANGLCLSALHDRAFDQGLITLEDDFTVRLSEQLRQRDEPFVREVLRPLGGRQIELPERFLPSVEFVAWHRQQVFIG
ncbi:MAG TPA: HNH endonuclease [Pseudomonas sp.]